MDIAQDHTHHRKTQQRIQTKNKAHGDRGRGEILLYPPRLYCSKNGTALEVKPHWKGAQKPASLEDFGAVKIYTIYLTLPRTKPMEIVAGERSCYTLLAFIALKMELHWRSNPIGKVRKNLPLWKILERHK